ncbi:cytochrome P450 [Antrihabitans sp. YC2-6]|uniref:cytochrome P450 n=1 Tax=Antrihabitans sp. YC2-6 TaxID=2799498 RepID=UPI0018F70070|nr:cytochrome P450 [Antrihabitans sp. YC2-6]MBJ8346234.1 cytochrome P450 [Antrihabitans sp. YC2-6]
METRSWLRWVALHAIPRFYLKAQARKGAPLSQVLMTEQGRVDPRPFVEQIRGHGPLVHTSLAWISADHRICRDILRNTSFGVANVDAITPDGLVKRFVQATDLKLAANPVEPPSMLMVDPPDHDRYRKPVARTFTPRAIGKLRDRVIDVTDGLLDDLDGRSRADLVDTFASRLPVDIIGTILGMPEEMRGAALQWGDSGAALLDLGIPWKAFRRAIVDIRAADAFLTGHIEELRHNPTDDIFSRLVSSGDLTDYELRATAALLLGAGFETTVNLIGNGIALLLEHDDQRELLRADPTLWASPVQQTARVALADVEVGGETIRAGNIVVLLLGGANYDPEVFADPFTFDVTRANAREHLSFSNGIHACLGASLARMEGEIALRSLFERFPDLRLDGKPARRDQVILRGYETMPVALGKSVAENPSLSVSSG